jgi:hypothetical protein
MSTSIPSSETALCRRLGIPDDAEHVLVLAESSHWDPDWLYTADEYYERFVRRNLDQALDELQREPRRVYSVECCYFLRTYWERQPARRAALRALANEGRLRLTHSGVTTADTLIPRGEALLRDWLIGQEWLRAQGIEQEPRLAYFTDSFGCTPALPSLLRAAGFGRTALTRVDGMHFVGAEYESKDHFPRPGSTAARLLEEERTLDFRWRDRQGAEVLCHWNAFNYGQGDMLAYRGINRIYIVNVAWPDRSERLVARRIAGFVDQLAPYSRTRYMFCPIGFDFVEPIPGLLELLDRYNRVRYGSTGTWAVNAGLDDYMALIEAQGDRLPRLEIDPNPYWTGFYSARPTLKRAAHTLVDRLRLAEMLSLLPENAAQAGEVARELAGPWWSAAISNHHDFITGTSPDRVVEEEQMPWLHEATAAVDRVVERLAPLPAGPAPELRAGIVPQWTRKEGRVRVRTPGYTVELDEARGGAIVDLRDTAGNALLVALSNDLIAYRGSGGLWRMGHEFRGGRWEQVEQASEHPAPLEVRETEEGLEVSSVVHVGGQAIRRTAWFRADTPLIRFRVHGLAPEGHTLTVRLLTSVTAHETELPLAMDTPGGTVLRPAARIYAPTYWPLHRFVRVRGDDGRQAALLCGVPSAVSYHPSGTLEAVALRNATRERAFGLLPLMAQPAAGHERQPCAWEYALLCGPVDEETLWRIAQEVGDNARQRPGLRELAARVVQVSDPQVEVWAAKPAARGEGIVVRLYSPAPPDELAVSLPGRPLRAAFLCDARERDLEALEVRDGAARLRMPGAVATVRLLTR